MKVEKLKNGEYRVRVRHSRLFEPALGIGKTEKDAWKDLAKDLAREYSQLEKEWKEQDRALSKIWEALDH